MARLREYLDALKAHYGPRSASEPASPIEPFVRAILSPGASPKSLEKAIHTMKVYGLLDAAKLRELDPDTLAMAVKPAGSAGAKALRLKSFVAWFQDHFDGDPDRMKAAGLDRLRDELLELALTPETADTILLEALGLATPIVDRHTYRVLTRHELVVEEAGYDDLKEIVERDLPRDAATYRDLHAVIVAVGKERCRKKPLCEGCPLERFLPGSRPRPGR
jgi:endonuclease-3 related protein